MVQLHFQDINEELKFQSSEASLKQKFRYFICCYYNYNFIRKNIANQCSLDR